MRTRTAVTAVVAGVLLLVVTVAGAYTAMVDRRTPAGAPDAVPARADPLTAAIESAQRRLEEVPGDHHSWAELGAAYVEQARVTANPGYYDKAEGALQESMALRPDGNDAALTGLGALANARHDFAGAADAASRALAVNEYSATAWGVLADARTQLGDYPGATAAAHRMVELRPGVASFARISYDAELHGDVIAARSALEQALEVAGSDSEKAFCRTYLGGLAFSTGFLDEAAEQYAAGLEVAPGDPALRLGQARIDAARGDVDGAVTAYGEVAAARPLPENLVEYGDYLESLGRHDDAADQYALLDDVRRLFVASGVEEDLGVALFAADHGDPAMAVEAAQAEFGRRQNVDAADALAWALHSAGRDAEALPYAEQATSLGGRNALFLYHRAVVEATLGRTDAARAGLAAALETNPHFSVLHAPHAAALLTDLGGPP
ncbi:MAG: tetratricopeptide repeat protein [Blastococcus sp.]